MKSLLTLSVFILLAINMKAQDLILLKNGNELDAKVMEVNVSEIKYKKSDNPDGPSYSVQRSDVFLIKYKNGTKDIISPITDADQKNKSSNPAAPSTSLTTNGTVELGGDLSFNTISGEGNSNSVTVISFNPYVGIMIASGFELGISPGVTSTSGSGGYSATTFNFFLAPAYNFNLGKAYPYCEFLIGYNSIDYSSTVENGMGIGGSGGVKAQIGGSGLLLFGLKYLHNNYGSNGHSNGLNTFSVEVGARIFINPKK
jgi:hypothetical protein